MIEIELNRWEIAIAGFVGVLRQSESIGRKLKNKMSPDNPFQTHCEGACGEAAVAKALNLWWGMGINTFKDPDIGDSIQVRCASKDTGELVFRDGDNPEHYYVLVTGKCPNYVVRGFLRGADIQRDEWVKNPNGRGSAFFAPQSALRPISELPIK